MYENLDLKLDGTYTITDKGRLSNETGVHEIPFTGTVPTGGELIYENNVLTNGCITMEEYKVNIEDGEITTVEKGSCSDIVLSKPCIAVSGDGTKPGNEISCGTENFYVVESNENTITMLAKYNLNVGDNKYLDAQEGVQNEDAVGNPGSGERYATVKFSDADYWSASTTIYPAFVYNENSNLYQYVENYVVYLESELHLVDVSGTLLSYEQVIDLECRTIGTCPHDWVYSIAYVLGSAGGPSAMWRINSNGGGLISPGTLSIDDGVRPVIIMAKSNI